MKWLINLFRKDEFKAEESISLGSRINTKFGFGVVVGGTVRVKYEKLPPMHKRHKNELTWTFDLKELSE